MGAVKIAFRTRCVHAGMGLDVQNAHWTTTYVKGARKHAATIVLMAMRMVCNIASPAATHIAPNVAFWSAAKGATGLAVARDA